MTDKNPVPHYLAKYDQLMTFWSGIFARLDAEDVAELELDLDRRVLGKAPEADIDPMIVNGLASVGFYAVVEHMRAIGAGEEGQRDE